MSKEKNSAVVRRAMRAYNKEIFEQWRITAPIISLVVIGTIFVFYLPPLVVARIVARTDTVTLANDWHYLVWFGGLWLAGEMMWRLAFYLMAKFEARTVKKLYTETLELLLSRDVSFFQDRFAGSITKNVLAYARRFEAYFDTLTFGVISQVGPAIFGLIVLAFISPVLSMALIIVIVITVALVRPLILHRSKIVKVREDLHAQMSGHISDVISNVATVKAFGAEKREQDKHKLNAGKYASVAYQSWQYHNTRIDMLVSPLYVFANVLGLAIIMSTGIDAASKASLFVAFNYFLSISRFMWDFNSIYRRLEEALTDAGLYLEYKDVVPKVTDKPRAAELVTPNGAINFNSVRFAHEKDGYDGLFQDFSLSIEPGQRVGVVGHSGAGKSTLVNLLLRFANVDSGNILIDNQAIDNVTQESLHKQIAYVPQEPALFHRSIRDNIGYGKLDATDDDVLRAARQAYAYEFIKDMPKGIDTMVGERGVKLSGGQRQRIAIARAILKDAPILVLDEATSALDSESEKLIQQSLTELMKDRTSIVIAHRLSTIAKLDRIIVLDNGQIVEDGSHSELLKNSGVYANLWKHQSGGFIED